MAVAFVQASTEVAVSSAVSGNVTVTGVGGGNLLVGLVQHLGTSVRTYTFSDDKGNTWANAVDVSSGGAILAQISYAKNVVAGNTIVTCTCNFSNTWYFLIVEFSGADTTTPLDQTSFLVEAIAGNNHTCSADGTVIDTAADVAVLCSANLLATGTASSAGGTYTNLNFSQTTRGIWQYKVSAGALTDEQGDWSHTGTARVSRGCIASFKGVAAPGGLSIPVAMYSYRQRRVNVS